MHDGYISLHRKIIDNWVFKNPDHLKAWITILMVVNHSSAKVIIGGKLFSCDRGESLNSLDTWSDKFGRNWNKSKVRRFFNLLESDHMVVTKSEQKTTRLSVCNYDNYQNPRNTDETQMKRKRNADETQVTPNNNDNNDKNDKNDNKKEKPAWKNNFEEYKKMAISAFNTIVTDKKEMTRQQSYYPGVDIKMSLRKSMTNF